MVVKIINVTGKKGVSKAKTIKGKTIKGTINRRPKIRPTRRNKLLGSRAILAVLLVLLSYLGASRAASTLANSQKAVPPLKNFPPITNNVNNAEARKLVRAANKGNGNNLRSLRSRMSADLNTAVSQVYDECMANPAVGNSLANTLPYCLGEVNAYIKEFEKEHRPVMNNLKNLIVWQMQESILLNNTIAAAKLMRKEQEVKRKIAEMGANRRLKNAEQRRALNNKRKQISGEIAQYPKFVIDVVKQVLGQGVQGVGNLGREAVIEAGGLLNLTEKQIENIVRKTMKNFLNVGRNALAGAGHAAGNGFGSGFVGLARGVKTATAQGLPLVGRGVGEGLGGAAKEGVQGFSEKSGIPVLLTIIPLAAINIAAILSLNAGNPANKKQDRLLSNVFSFLWQAVNNVGQGAGWVYSKISNKNGTISNSSLNSFITARRGSSSGLGSLLNRFNSLSLANTATSS